MSWVGVDVGAAGRSGSLRWTRVGDAGEPTGSGATPIVADYVAALGSPDPVIVGTTPYGREALVGEALGEIIAESGDAVAGLGIVHDDGVDPYRLTMLVEAARLAGVAPERVVLVPRSQAAGGNDDDEPRGAAVTARTMLSAGTEGGTSAAVAASGAGGGIGGAILGSQLLQGGGTAIAAGAAAGPAGAALAGPAGTALAGPAGTAAAGPVGGAVAGATGTPLAASGPAGVVLVPIAQVASKAKWIPILGGAAVGAAVIVGVAVVATGGDDEVVVTTDPPAVVTTPDTPPDTPPPTPAPATTISTPATTIAAATTTEMTTTTSTTTTTTTTSTTVAPITDFTALLGSWQTGCISESGGSVYIVYTISGTSPDAMSIRSAPMVFAGAGCSGAGHTLSDDTSMTIVGMTVVDGLDAFQISTPDGDGVMAVDGNTLYLGEGASFDPVHTSTRL